MMDGAKYLRHLLNRYDNDVVPALAADYYGPSRVSKNRIAKKALDYVAYIAGHHESIIYRAEKGHTGRPVVASVYTHNKPASKVLVI